MVPMREVSNVECLIMAVFVRTQLQSQRQKDLRTDRCFRGSGGDTRSVPQRSRLSRAVTLCQPCGELPTAGQTHRLRVGREVDRGTLLRSGFGSQKLSSFVVAT